MPTKKELKTLAHIRLKEAKSLFDAGLYRGAYYLAGYTIELALKARICKTLNIESYLDTNNEVSRVFKTHDFDRLLLLSGLKTKFEDAMNLDNDLKINWNIVKNWNEGYRYRPVGPNLRSITSEFLDAIDNTRCGVFTWIKKNW